MTLQATETAVLFHETGALQGELDMKPNLSYICHTYTYIHMSYIYM